MYAQFFLSNGEAGDISEYESSWIFISLILN